MPTKAPIANENASPRLEDQVPLEEKEGTYRGEETRKAWDRLDDETDASWHAFIQYRDAPPRERRLGIVEHLRGRKTESKDKRGERQGRTSLIDQWSSRYRWLERSRAHDDYQFDLRAKEEEEAIRDDMETARARRRTLRNDAFDDYATLSAVVRKLALGPLDPKNVRELAIARERLGIMAKEAFYGLPIESLASQVEEMPPDMASAWNAFLVAWHIGKQSVS